MSPRPYRLGQRQKATEQTRARILTAARELLWPVMLSPALASTPLLVKLMLHA